MSAKHSIKVRVRFKNLGFLGFPKYWVGNNGAVWSHQYEKWRRLRPGADRRTGHLAVVLCNKGHMRIFAVHRLVLLAFVGPKPKGGVCRHFPERDPTNNRLENLQWGTPSQNLLDRRVHGTVGDNKGERHGMHKLTKEAVLDIRRRVAGKECTQRALAKEYNVCFQLISMVVNRKIWEWLE